MAILLSLFFRKNIGQEQVFYDILIPKNAFRGYKNKKLKKSKNWDFSKGVNPWFWSEKGHFFIFFLIVIYARKICFTIFLQRKNAFLRYKNKKFKKSKNWDFSKGVSPWFRSKNGNFSIFISLGNIGQEQVIYDILKPKKRLSRL